MITPLRVTPARITPVRTKSAFAALVATPRRGAAGSVRVRYVAGDPGRDDVRVAYAVRGARNAVERNRVRRRLRAAMRARGAPSGTYLVTAGIDTASMRFADLCEALDRALHAAAASSP